MMAGAADVALDPFGAAESDVDALAVLLEGCANPGVNRHALMLTLAALPASAARPQHLRLVAQALDPLRGLDRARLFRLADGNLVLVWRGAAPAAVQEATTALTQMFDNLAASAAPLFAVLELPRDTALIEAAIAGSVHVAPSAAASATRPLDPVTLARLETALAQADVAHFSRRRPVCRCPASGLSSLAWETRSLSIRQLAQALAPGTDARSDPWLFARLTHTLDRRMLTMLSDHNELREARPFALDINVAGILGPEFLRFDAALPAGLRGEVVLNVLPADILGDAGAFEFARDFAHARGYRLLLRDMTPGWLMVLPAELLGVDLVQLRMLDDLPTELPGGLDAARTVLAGVGTKALLAWGQARGVALFEGEMIKQGQWALSPGPP